jgi:hypothetical protein
MRFQLWTQDEYGTGAIVGSYESSDKALDTGRKMVTESNFANALASTDRMRNIEAYLVEVSGKSSYYGGNRRGGKHVSYKAASAEPVEMDPVKATVKIYIGSTFKKNGKTNEETKVYMTNEKGEEIASLKHPSLVGKTVYFVVPIK